MRESQVSGIGCREEEEAEVSLDSYRDLRVWQLGMDVAAECYFLTRDFPKAELYGMTSQIRRASSSIPANIAEGYARRHRGEYVQFLHIANGSLKEVETFLQLAVRVELAQSEAVTPLLQRCDDLGKMLLGLIRSLESGVGGRGSGVVREDQEGIQYTTSNDADNEIA